jgi:(p)ppGpp synthase/HD superfamily hydrolase
MTTYAQTILQLYDQLKRDGYSSDEMTVIHNVYEISMSLFSGRFQPSGKGFMSHGVGTASILASLRLPVQVVAAGLIHNVYWVGDFGDGNIGISKAKREKIRRIVGKEIEEYVNGFAARKWNKQTLTVIRDTIDTLDPLDRNVLLIELADQLEFHLDLGVLYCGEARQKLIEGLRPIILEIADRLGFPILASELARLFKETASTEIPVKIRTNNTWGFVIAPKSYCKRLTIEFHDLLVSGFGRLRSAVKLGKMSKFTKSDKDKLS